MSRDLGQTFTSISNNVNSTHEYLWYGYIYNLVPLFLISLFSCLLLFSLLSPLFLSLLGVSCLTIQTLAQYITMSIIPMTLHVSLSLLHVFDDVCMILLPVQVCMYIVFVSFPNDVKCFIYILSTLLSCTCTVGGNCVIVNACTLYAVLSVTFWYMFLYPLLSLSVSLSVSSSLIYCS